MSGYVYMPWDCCRCTNEACVDRESCLRYIARADTGYRTPFFDWDAMPRATNATECGHYIKYPSRPPEIKIQRGDE
jgi:hypothetical protein